MAAIEIVRATTVKSRLSESELEDVLVVPLLAISTHTLVSYRTRRMRYAERRYETTRNRMIDVEAIQEETSTAGSPQKWMRGQSNTKSFADTMPCLRLANDFCGANMQH